MTSAQNMRRRDEQLVHLVREYRKGNWGAELLYSATDIEAYGLRNAAHRAVTQPRHIESHLLLGRLGLR